MYELIGKTMRYALDEQGRCASCMNLLSGHEYVEEPEDVWKLIYALHGTERVEAVIWAQQQKATLHATETTLELSYDRLVGDDGRIIDASLKLCFEMTEQGLRATAHLSNRDAFADLMELQLTPVAGVRTLSGKHEEDSIAWPCGLGKRVPDPAFSDLSTYAGYRKYERHDQFHTDMDALYQGDSASMQWFDWYNNQEGLYIGSEDTTRQALCLHVERDTKKNLLRFGMIRYPMLKAGESWDGLAIDCFPHLGDWHAGARIYRTFMDREGGFTPPKRPAWCQDFTGWLRVILKQHHCELNWSFDDIPALYDELEAVGFKTLYLLGWEKGGFARMWPDYIVDDRMGGEEKLRAGIDYVHRKGGKVLMFLSYALVDHHSEFYKYEGGDQVTIKSIWQEDIPFAETYCGEGTYRKICNPAMPMYLACPGAPLWQEKMKEAAKVCLDLGADGVLYDIGALSPFFCYAPGHTHDKPSHSHENKAANYADLRRYVKSFGEDKIILMEHNVDIYGQSMDMVHSGNTTPDVRLTNPGTAADLAAAKQDTRLCEMYRYTFPELLMTNRECGEDEINYRANAGYSFLLGLRFDMTIYRCCGTFKDIPNYAAYLKELNALSERYADYLLRGRFVDVDGFTCDNPLVMVKGWQGVHGGLAVTLWNPTAEVQQIKLVSADGKHTKQITIPPETATAEVLVEA